ncbi:MAG: quinone-dependent dihydroorotate dehydrogenase, partial [Bacteroidales bacterium]
MYRFLIRPLLFLLPPETIHHLLVGFLRILCKVPGATALIRRMYYVTDPRLRTEFLGMSFDHPVGLAAGFDKNASVTREFHAFGFSFVEIGTVTPLGQPGNPKPRSFRLPADKALVNRMGFNNGGVQAAAERLAGKRPKGLVLGGNLGKNTQTPNDNAVGDYETVFRSLYDRVDYFVVNVSCPNISDLRKLQDQEGLERILGRLVTVRNQQTVRKPLLLKISPDLNDQQLDETLEIIRKLGVDGIVATNTTVARTGLKSDPETVASVGKGGLSGAPLTARSLEMVRAISQKTGGTLPIIAVGGIMSVEDALAMFDAGASLIQLYTGFIYGGPALAKRINRALLARMDQ